jgi:hypothetical protein
VGLRLALALLLLVGSAGCMHRLPTLSDDESRDLSIFSAVVEAISAAPERPLLVDPRPLEGEPGVTWPAATNLAEVSPEVVEARSAVLARLRITATDAITPRLCTGSVRILREQPGTDPKLRSECPADGRFRVAIVGLPRSGGAYAPFVKIDEREEGTRLGHWVARAIEDHYTPEGWFREVSDYVVERRPKGKGWQVVKVKRVLTDQRRS